MNEPGVAVPVGTLTKTLDRTLYAVMGDKNIYKLPADENEWHLVNEEFCLKKPRAIFPLLNTMARFI